MALTPHNPSHTSLKCPRFFVTTLLDSVAESTRDLREPLIQSLPFPHLYTEHQQIPSQITFKRVLRGKPSHETRQKFPLFATEAVAYIHTEAVVRSPYYSGTKDAISPGKACSFYLITLRGPVRLRSAPKTCCGRIGGKISLIANLANNSVFQVL